MATWTIFSGRLDGHHGSARDTFPPIKNRELCKRGRAGGSCEATRSPFGGKSDWRANRTVAMRVAYSIFARRKTAGSDHPTVWSLGLLADLLIVDRCLREKAKSVPVR